MDSDPTADLTDDDVRRVCDEADEECEIGAMLITNPEKDRRMVGQAISTRNDGWYTSAREAVARLRAERAKKGTP